MIGLIYLLTNMENGKVYVGQTKSTLDRRWGEHVTCANRANGKGSPYLHAAIRKYGSKHFHREVLFVAFTKEDLNTLEISTIQAYGSMDPKKGYNIGAGGYDVGPEARAKVSAAHKASGLRPPVPTPEQRAAVGAANSIRMKGVEPKAASAAVMKAVVAAGIEYPSVTAAAQALDTTVTTIRARIRDDRRADYHWVGETKIASGRASTNITVTHRGVTYPSLKAACEALGVERGRVNMRLRRAGVDLTQPINCDELPFDPFGGSRYNLKE